MFEVQLPVCLCNGFFGGTTGFETWKKILVEKREAAACFVAENELILGNGLNN